MEYDDGHRIISRRPLSTNGTIDVHYKYDPASGALIGIDSKNGPAKIFGYDANGNLSSAVIQEVPHHYSFSASGDLTAYSAKGLDLAFAPDPDGLIASIKDAKDANAFAYTAGGELANVAFADGRKAKYEYQPSGLRAKLTYNDGRQTRYTYDPAGNLLSTEIFDAHSKQVQGQKLILNESYQVVKRVLFDAVGGFDARALRSRGNRSHGCELDRSDPAGAYRRCNSHCRPRRQNHVLERRR